MRCAAPTPSAGSGPALESVATEVVRVPSLNGSEARDALRRLGADVAVSLDNAIIRPETFTLPAHGTINVHHGAVPGYRGGPPCSGSSATGSTGSGSRST